MDSDTERATGEVTRRETEIQREPRLGGMGSSWGGSSLYHVLEDISHYVCVHSVYIAVLSVYIIVSIATVVQHPYSVSTLALL